VSDGEIMTLTVKVKAPKMEKSLSPPHSYSLETFSQDGSDGVDGERKVWASLVLFQTWFFELTLFSFFSFSFLLCADCLSSLKENRPRL